MFSCSFGKNVIILFLGRDQDLSRLFDTNMFYTDVTMTHTALKSEEESSNLLVRVAEDKLAKFDVSETDSVLMAVVGNLDDLMEETNGFDL